MTGSNEVGRIVVPVEADPSRLVAGLDAAKSATERAAAEMEATIRGVQTEVNATGDIYHDFGDKAEAATRNVESSMADLGAATLKTATRTLGLVTAVGAVTSALIGLYKWAKRTGDELGEWATRTIRASTAAMNMRHETDSLIHEALNPLSQAEREAEAATAALTARMDELQAKLDEMREALPGDVHSQRELAMQIAALRKAREEIRDRLEVERDHNAALEQRRQILAANLALEEQAKAVGRSLLDQRDQIRAHFSDMIEQAMLLGRVDLADVFRRGLDQELQRYDEMVKEKERLEIERREREEQRAREAHEREMARIDEEARRRAAAIARENNARLEGQGVRGGQYQTLQMLRRINRNTRRQR